MAKRGILYAPDYVINAGGIINVGAGISRPRRRGGSDFPASGCIPDRLEHGLGRAVCTQPAKIPPRNVADRIAQRAHRARLTLPPRQGLRLETRRNMHALRQSCTRFLSDRPACHLDMRLAGASVRCCAAMAVFAGLIPVAVRMLSAGRERAHSCTCMCRRPGWAWAAGSGIAIASLTQLVWRHPLAGDRCDVRVAVPPARCIHRASAWSAGSIWGSLDLGHLVAMGRSDDLHARPAVPLFRLYCALANSQRREDQRQQG